MSRPFILRFDGLAAFILPWILADPLYGQDATGGPGRIRAMDESRCVVLRGHRHPPATSANDRGEVDPSLPMQRMRAVLQGDPVAQAALDPLVTQQHEKSSPNFHAWLTPAQCAEKFGTASSDIQELTGWLALHGFQVSPVARSGMLIEFGGTAGLVKDAFHTPIHSYTPAGKHLFPNAALGLNPREAGAGG